MFDRKINLFAGLAAGAVGGLAGAWVKAKLEEPLKAATDRVLEDGDADVTRTPHGVPPVALVEKAAGQKPETSANGRRPSTASTTPFPRRWGPSTARWRRSPRPITAGNGAAVAGVALWLGAHEAALPLLGLTPAAARSCRRATTSGRASRTSATA